MRDGALSGRTSFVEGAQTATHFLVLTDAGVAMVAAGAPGLAMQSTPGLAVPALSELTFANTPAVHWTMSANTIGGHRGGGAACLRRPRARRRATRLRDGRRARQGAKAVRPVDRSVPGGAAQARRLPDQPGWRAPHASNPPPTPATVAIRTGGSSRRRHWPSPARRSANVSIQTHRALGAIGYAEEHEAPRHFRRVHADLARFGGAPRARAELADLVLGPAT